jgi:hypothetical protein
MRCGARELASTKSMSGERRSGASGQARAFPAIRQDGRLRSYCRARASLSGQRRGGIISAAAFAPDMRAHKPVRSDQRRQARTQPG